LIDFGFETSSIKTKLEEGGRAHHIVELDAELEAQILKLFLSYNTVQYNQRTIKIERSEGNEAIAYSKIFLGQTISPHANCRHGAAADSLGQKKRVKWVNASN
jgi:hypothetical protein